MCNFGRAKRKCPIPREKRLLLHRSSNTNPIKRAGVNQLHCPILSRVSQYQGPSSANTCHQGQGKPWFQPTVPSFLSASLLFQPEGKKLGQRRCFGVFYLGSQKITKRSVLWEADLALSPEMHLYSGFLKDQVPKTLD